MQEFNKVYKCPQFLRFCALKQILDLLQFLSSNPNKIKINFHKPRLQLFLGWLSPGLKKDGSVEYFVNLAQPSKPQSEAFLNSIIARFAQYFKLYHLFPPPPIITRVSAEGDKVHSLYSLKKVTFVISHPITLLPGYNTYIL